MTIEKLSELILDGYHDSDQPRDYFLSASKEFLTKLGKKSFWSIPEKDRENQLSDLLTDYLRSDHAGYEDKDANTMIMISNEYRRREEMLKIV